MAETVPIFTEVINDPYPHYTQCVEADAYDPMNQYLQMTIAGLEAGAVGAAMVAAAGAPWCLLIVAVIAMAAAGLAYCDWWLNDRLICLPADVTASTGPAVDVCTIGMYLEYDQDDPTWVPFAVGDLDTDWTMDLVLCGTNVSAPVDVLLQEDTAISNLGLGFENGGDGQTASWLIPNVYTGQSLEYANGGTTVTAPVLHCEVEGAGVSDFQNWLTATFWAAVAALIALLAIALAGPIGWVVSAILAALLFLLSLLGFYASENDQASPPQAPPGTSLQLNGPVAKNGDQQAASVVCVVGTWVYDSAHEGWNEIHPAKSVQIVGAAQPDLQGNLTCDPTWADHCSMVGQAASGLTIANQALPANGWTIHPVLDGCGTYPTAPPPEDIR